MTKQIEWQRRMKMRGGKIGHYLGQCEVTKRHRVMTSNRHDEITDPKDSFTVWLVDDFGLCRGDKAPCDEDVMGAA